MNNRCSNFFIFMCFLYYFICKIKYNNLKKQEDGSEKLSSCFEMNQKVIFKASCCLIVIVKV